MWKSKPDEKHIMKARKKRQTYPCPNCGAPVRAEALACPECGSDDATGWSEEADAWDAGASGGYAEDDDFDYDDFIRREFGEGKRALSWKKVGFVTVAVLCIILVIILFVI